MIVYNAQLTSRGIPLEAYEYVVNGKSAIEWIRGRYAVTIGTPSIRSPPDFFGIGTASTAGGK